MIPGVTERARQVFAQSAALGADPQAFSKVGDCQSIKEVLLGRYDQPGRYTLPADSSGLEDTIRYYAGSFNRDGQAVKGGYNAAAVLSPMWADPAACQAGENPLECEFRVHHPSVVIISLEVWWQGRTTQRYIDYMRKIIEFSLAHGALPVLSTKADNVEGDHSINLATARLAYEYDLPLWNFWRAVQGLPNHGLDPDRPDQFHISPAAWDVRSLTALQTLDALRRGASTASTGSASTGSASTSSAGDGASTASTGSASTGSADDGASTGSASTGSAGDGDTLPAFSAGQIQPGGEFALLNLTRRAGESNQPLGVAVLNVSTGQLTRLGDAGLSLQSLSPDGGTLLAARGHELLAVSLETGQAQRTTDQFAAAVGVTGALWLDDATLAVIADRGKGAQLWRTDPTGKDWAQLTPAGADPAGLLPGGGGQQVYWQQTCAGDGCTPRLWVSTLTGEAPRELSPAVRPAFSPAGDYLAATAEDAGQGELIVASLDGKVRRQITLGGSRADYRLVGYHWSADGKKLAALLLARSTYSGKAFDVRAVAVTPANWGVQELATTRGLNPLAAWSPDGTRLLLSASTQGEDGAYSLRLTLAEPSARKVKELSLSPALASPDVLLVTGLVWGRLAE